jgi:hypothetical protein
LARLRKFTIWRIEAPHRDLAPRQGAAGLAGGSRHFASTMIFTYSYITTSE